MELQPGMRALVTGASSGIGAALAERLAARGVDVGIVARRTDRLQEVLDRCVAAGATGSRLWTVDLGDLDAAVRLAEEAWTDFGPLDVVVHNAGDPDAPPRHRPHPRGGRRRAAGRTSAHRSA